MKWKIKVQLNFKVLLLLQEKELKDGKIIT